MVVDQSATIGALTVAVAQDMGITVGYLPGLSMRRIADLTPGNAKTDARDAAVIAGTARTMPHTLHAISTSDEDVAALSMLTGFDLDLARQLIALHAQRADVATQVKTPVQAHPHMPSPDLHARDRVQDRRRLPGRDPGQDLRHRRPTGLLYRAHSRHTPLRLIDPW